MPKYCETNGSEWEEKISEAWSAKRELLANEIKELTNDLDMTYPEGRGPELRTEECWRLSRLKKTYEYALYPLGPTEIRNLRKGILPEYQDLPDNRHNNTSQDHLGSYKEGLYS